MLRAKPAVLAASLLLTGCVTAGSYQPAFFDLPADGALAAGPAVDGRVLVVTSPAQDGLVFKDHPTTFTGSLYTLQLPLGVIVREAALKAFGEAFAGGAEHGGERPAGASFTAVVTPAVTRFDWEVHFTSLMGGAHPTVNLELSVSLLDGDGQVSWERRYLVSEQDPGGLSSTTDLLGWLTHQAALEAMRQAARDVAGAPSPQAAVAAPSGEPVAATPEPPRRPPRPVELFLESGLGVGTTSLPVRFDDGSTGRVNTGGIRLGGGLRFLRLLEGRLETRASIGLTIGPPQVALKVPVDATLASFDAEVTEDLLFGDFAVGAGWYQRLLVSVDGEGTVAESWRGRPSWVVHLERCWETTFSRVALGFRVAGERMVAEGGPVVNGAVLGLYVSLTGWLSAPSADPPAAATPPEDLGPR